MIDEVLPDRVQFGEASAHDLCNAHRSDANAEVLANASFALRSDEWRVAIDVHQSCSVPEFDDVLAEKISPPE